MKLRLFPAAICCASFAVATFDSRENCYAQGAKTSAAEVQSTDSADSEDTSVVTVAIGSLDTLVPNLQHLLRTAGAGAVGGTLSGLVKQYAAGVDQKRPIGLFVDLDETGQPVSVACLPVSDLEAFFESLSIFGESNDLGDGLYEFDLSGNSVYGKSSGDWLYVALTEDALEAVDENASGSLAKMLQKYDLRVKLNPQNIPDDLVDFFIGQMEAGLEQSMATQNEDMDEEEAATAKATSEQMIAQTEEFIQGTESLVVGLMVNKGEKKTILDFGSKFVADSKFAKQMEKAAAAKSVFGGIPQDSSMMTLQYYQLFEPEDIGQMEKMIEGSLKTAMKEIEKNGDAATQAKAKDYMNRIVDLVLDGAKTGKAESAVDVSVDGPLSIVISFSVADGSKVEALAADLAKEAESSPVPFKLQIGTGKYAGVNLHKLTADLPPDADDSARKIFGDKVNVAIGTSAKAVHLAIGKSADDNLKSAIDRAGKTPSSASQMIKMRLTMTQLLNYIQSIQSTPFSEAMLNATTSGNDQISIDSQIVERGAVVRLSVEDGVIKGVSAGVKAGMASGGGF